MKGVFYPLRQSGGENGQKYRTYDKRKLRRREGTRRDGIELFKVRAEGRSTLKLARKIKIFDFTLTLPQKNFLWTLTTLHTHHLLPNCDSEMLIIFLDGFRLFGH